MRSLSWKLGGALLLIVVISVGLMFYLTDLGTTREFNQYVAHGNAMYLQMASDSLGQHYAEEGSWSAVQGVLTDLTQSPGDRLVLADSSGTIVGDTGNQWLGRSAPEVGLTGGTPVTAAGREVGELYLVSSGPGSGMGHMMGRMMGGDSTPPTATAEQDFLDRTRTNLWLAGLIAAAIALVLGLVITRQITRPIRALTEGARHLARGEMEHRVNVSSRDEIGQLARSFNIMADNLHQGEITRRQLIADVAHELRTPLSV
ncbi:MAG: HAMP domain-containing protein, partial [Chloroflexota bacterium]